MYLLHIPAERAGIDHWLFFESDPRSEGCSRDVVTDVHFRDLPALVSESRASSSMRLPVLARSSRPPSHYKLFVSKQSVPEDFEVLDGFAFQFPTWKEFMETPIAKDDSWNPIV